MEWGPVVLLSHPQLGLPFDSFCRRKRCKSPREKVQSYSLPWAPITTLFQYKGKTPSPSQLHHFPERPTQKSTEAISFSTPGAAVKTRTESEKLKN